LETVKENKGNLIIEIKKKLYQGQNNAPTHLAIEDLYFKIPKAQFCSVVGPSGCGKTTMLNIAAGLDKTLSGAVYFDDGSIPEEGKLSYMFQSPRLLPWASVRDNVKIVLNNKAEEIEKAEELLVQMGLEKFLDSYPSKLSGGMQRRVALARAFAVKPRLLLLDEPFVSLDVPVGNNLRSMLLKLWEREPTTILFVTHDLREAIFLSDRIIFLSNAPAKLLLDVKIDIARPRDIENKNIEDFRKELLDKNKSLLTGILKK